MNEVRARLSAAASGAQGRGRLAAAVVATALVALGAVASPAAAASGVSVFPVPGSGAALPQTQITFRGVPPAALGRVTVTGSVSGVHAGTVGADSDGNGASFIPSQPFTPGETVTVSTSLPLLGTTGGAPGGLGTSYQFNVIQPGSPFPVLHWPPAGRQPGDVQSFHSRPDLSPVTFTISRAGGSASGDIFVAPQWGPVQDGPMILDPQGQLVWFDHLAGKESAADFRVQRYDGQPVLTWWEGTLVAGVGLGQGVIFDRTYRQIAVVRAGNGLSADLHEFAITPQNTALIVADVPVYADARSAHGSSHQLVLDSIVQEIDIPTGLVLFQWNALDHVPLADTYQLLPRSPRSPFDAYHINSVELDRDGSLIVSMRNTWAAYKLDHQTGAVLWALGGRHSSFKLARGTYWAYQHDARVRSVGDHWVTIFDDSGGPPRIHSQSRAIKLYLDTKHMTAHQVTAHVHSPALSSNYEGGYQQLRDGDDFVGWGQQPFFSEYDRHGKLVFDAHFNAFTASYRAYRFPWTATPWTKPAVGTSVRGRSAAVYMTWNGATSVTSWQVLGGASATALKPIVRVTKRSFETGVRIRRVGYVAVQALDSHRHVLGSSAVVAVH